MKKTTIRATSSVKTVGKSVVARATVSNGKVTRSVTKRIKFR